MFNTYSPFPKERFDILWLASKNILDRLQSRVESLDFQLCLSQIIISYDSVF